MPSDATLVEIDSASGAPSRIVIIVTTTDTVDAVELGEANTEEGRACIRILGASGYCTEQVRRGDSVSKTAI